MNVVFPCKLGLLTIWFNSQDVMPGLAALSFRVINISKSEFAVGGPLNVLRVLAGMSSSINLLQILDNLSSRVPARLPERHLRRINRMSLNPLYNDFDVLQGSGLSN